MTTPDQDPTPAAAANRGASVPEAWRGFGSGSALRPGARFVLALMHLRALRDAALGRTRAARAALAVAHGALQEDALQVAATIKARLLAHGASPIIEHELRVALRWAQAHRAALGEPPWRRFKALHRLMRGLRVDVRQDVRRGRSGAMDEGEGLTV